MNCNTCSFLSEERKTLDAISPNCCPSTAFIHYQHYSSSFFMTVSNFLLYIFLHLVVVDPLHARYLIAHKLASGGFGDIYAGVRKKDGMRVALKVVPKKRMREINTVS
jgi:hypothetical protein